MNCAICRFHCRVILLVGCLFASGIPAADEQMAYGQTTGRARCRQVEFSNSADLLAACFGARDKPGTLRVWDWRTGDLLWEHQEATGICSLSFSSDDRLIAVGMYGTSGKVLDAESGKTVTVIRGHEDHVIAVAFAGPNRLVTGSSDKSVRLWNVASGAQLAILGEHKDGVSRVEASPDGNYLISSATSPDLRLWDLNRLKQIKVFELTDLICPNSCFSFDGDYFLSARWDGKVRIRESATQNLIASISLSALRDVALSPDNQVLLCCEDRSEINALNLRLGGATPSDREEVMKLVKLWNDEKYEVREQASREIVALGAVALPMLRKLSRMRSAEIRIRARTASEEISDAPPHRIDVGHQHNVGTVSFSADNTHVASGDAGGIVKVWQMHNHQVIRTLHGPALTEDQ